MLAFGLIRQCFVFLSNFILFLAQPPAGTLDMASTDRATLFGLFRSTGGAGWIDNKDNWATDADISEWKGVTVDAQGRVAMLVLPFLKLQGILLQLA